MKKALKIIGITLVALFIVAMLVLNVFLGDIVEQAVRKGGPIVLGVPVELESADMRLLRGKIGITGLSVGNPEGFKTDNLFSLGSIKIDIAPASIFSDTIHIRSIEIVAPEITYERGLKSSNISALIDSLEGEETDEEETAEEKPEKKEKQSGGKRVIIDRLSITGGRVKLSTKLAGGLAAPVPLPPIVMHDIGKESNGAEIIDVIKQVLPAVARATATAATAVIKIAGEGLEDAAALTMEGAAMATDLATDAAKQATAGAAAIAGGTTEAAKDVTAGAAKAVGAGAKGLLGGLKKVVPGGD
jgi:uncharacterized protein involved in outer membrane biogenesis